MEVEVIYGPRFKKRINVHREKFSFRTKATLLDLFILLTYKYDRRGVLMFVTTDIRLGSNVKVLINGKTIMKLTTILKNKDKIELS